MSREKLIYISISVFFVLIVWAVVSYFFAPVGGSVRAVGFNIEQGVGFREIAHNLKGAGLIKSPATFLIYGFMSGSAHKLKAGNYTLSNDMSLPEIISALVQGPEEDIAITVKEGETLAEIEKKLVQAGIIKPGGLSKFPGKSLEGFLFPDTYRFFPNSPANDVIRKFLANFQAKTKALSETYSGDFYKALIVASLIEKEVPFSEDRHLVSGIIYKRLAIGMPLQIDAAPDTYNNYGLPKKPIANPGLDALRAAIYPKSSDYLYYLSDPLTKRTIFSKTFEEHKENKLKYLGG